MVPFFGAMFDAGGDPSCDPAVPNPGAPPNAGQRLGPGFLSQLGGPSSGGGTWEKGGRDFKGKGEAKGVREKRREKRKGKKLRRAKRGAARDYFTGPEKSRFRVLGDFRYANRRSSLSCVDWCKPRARSYHIENFEVSGSCEKFHAFAI